jgi:hypothetical protein
MLKSGIQPKSPATAMDEKINSIAAAPSIILRTLMLPPRAFYGWNSFFTK